MVRLRFREVDRDLFDHVRAGRKRYELRANTDRFKDVGDGDAVTVACTGETVEFRVKKARRFADLTEALQVTPVPELMPGITDVSVAVKRINGFPGYAEKIRKHGVLVMELERP